VPITENAVEDRSDMGSDTEMDEINHDPYHTQDVSLQNRMSPWRTEIVKELDCTGHLSSRSIDDNSPPRHSLEPRL
jgi:hypothetical protein